MSQRFYRSFLDKQVDKYVQSCDVCQKIKSSGKRNRAELKIITSSRTNQIVATEFTGPIKVPVRGNKHLMIKYDSFSKYLVFRPTTDKETTTVANVMLEHWFWIFGIPESILSDRG